MLTRLAKRQRREARIKALETVAIVAMVGGVALLLIVGSILNTLALRGVAFF